MPIHKEGKKILAAALVILLAINFVVVRYLLKNQLGCVLFALFSLLTYAWLVYFFRNPFRNISLQEDGVLSPADGKVVLIQRVDEHEYLHETRIQVSIFLSLFDVHVNRNPISGTIKYFKYHPGKYLVAWHPKSSLQNERTTVVIENKKGVKVLFRQVAGILARRICFYPQEGDQVQQGSEFGFIRFGSRVDVLLPSNAMVKVTLGERVQGGVSMLAEL